MKCFQMVHLWQDSEWKVSHVVSWLQHQLCREDQHLFLGENVFNMLVDPNIDIAALIPEKHLTESDQQLLTSVKQDVNAHSDIIIGTDIVGTIMVSLIGKRLLYLKEFAEGMKLFGVLEAVRAYPDVMKSLFVKGHKDNVLDANYVFPLCGQSIR